MYEQFYGFSAAPFARQPASGDYAFTGPHRRVLETLENRVRQGSCMCLLHGPAGVGKSALVEGLRKALGDAVTVCVLDAAEATPDKPLAASFLADCGVDCNADSEAGFGKYLKAYRHTLSESGCRTLLVVDHAHALTAPDCRLLETLVDSDGDTPVQILFLGMQADALTGAGQAACAGLAQRIVEEFALAPLSPMDSDEYIRQRLTRAGGSAELFTSAASAAVYRYSRGIPRLINRVCDLALVYGYSRQSRQIDEQTMDFVLNDRWGGSQQPESAAPVSGSTPAAPVTAAAAVSESEPGKITEEFPQGAGADAQLARQLVEMLKQGSAAGESPQGKVSDRDMYDFIRLSLRYHQRHVERFVLGIVVGVALLAAGGLWTLITWQNDQLMPSAVASNPPAYSAAEAALDASPLPLQPEVAGVMINTTAAQTQSPAALPVLAPAEPEQRSAPVPPVARPPEPGSEEEKRATLDSATAAENLALVREHERLERERRKLKKQLEAERARREKLRQEAEAEQERARKAQMLIEEARKSARAAWDHIDAETPDAFPEE